MPPRYPGQMRSGAVAGRNAAPLTAAGRLFRSPGAARMRPRARCSPDVRFRSWRDGGLCVETAWRSVTPGWKFRHATACVRLWRQASDGGEVSETEHVPAGIDPTRPSPARMYDYMLGGTHNFQVDRDATEQFRAQMPDLEDAAWANRGFHGRAARWMATEHGIRQFIDIGSGLPTQSNTHEVVRAVAAGARVVYVD